MKKINEKFTESPQKKSIWANSEVWELIGFL